MCTCKNGKIEIERAGCLVTLADCDCSAAQRKDHVKGIVDKSATAIVQGTPHKRGKGKDDEQAAQ